MVRSPRFKEQEKPFIEGVSISFLSLSQCLLGIAELEKLLFCFFFFFPLFPFPDLFEDEWEEIY